MRAASYWLALDILTLVVCMRTQIGRDIKEIVSGPRGTVCKISEREDGDDATYQIQFGVQIEDCNEMSNCNFFNMRQIAKRFLRKPLRTPPTGRIGQCRCDLKKLEGEEFATFKKLPGERADRALLEFVSTEDEPCDEMWCWKKYNQFVSLSTRVASNGASFRNESESGNHWHVRCEDGDASLAGLKTIMELHDEASEPARLEMSRFAAKAGILSDAPKSGSRIKRLQLSLTGDVSARTTLGDTSSSEVAPEVSRHESQSPETSVADPSLDRPIRNTGNVPNIQVIDYDAEGEQDIASPREGDAHKNGNADLHDEQPVQTQLGGKSADHNMPEAVVNSLRPTRDLLELVEAKLSTMLIKAEEFKEVTALMKLGNLEAAKRDPNAAACETLQANMATLLRVLSYSMSNLQSFSSATRIEGMDSKLLERLLWNIREAWLLQFRVADSLERWVATVEEARRLFDEENGAGADEIAEYTLVQLGLLKDEVKMSRKHLQDALASITA